MASSPSDMSAEDQMRSEIARLTATINQHKYGNTSGYQASSYHSGGYGQYGGGYRGRGRGRGGGMAPGNAGPHKQYVRPGLVTKSGKGKESSASVSVGEESPNTSPVVDATAEDTNDKDDKVKAAEGGAAAVGGRKEVIIGGVAFEASKRSLVRKGLPKSKAKAKKPGSRIPDTFMRKGARGHLMSRSRVYKPTGRSRNMTLDNTSRTYTQSKKSAIRKIDKPCSRFTKTGTCSRGLTCPYQHDAKKIAICWNFMQGSCPKSADSCTLSHNPTPERTPLCVHFLNRGRCTKEKCLFPHVNVGKKEGVCKDFAVLGYCERGVECEKNHVRECPEFEETGECRTRGCKLPHVIKANAKWAKRDSGNEGGGEKEAGVDKASVGEEGLTTAESGELGDEYISLVFNESESEEEDEDEEEEEEEEGEEEEEESSEGMEVHV